MVRRAGGAAVQRAAWPGHAVSCRAVTRAVSDARRQRPSRRRGAGHDQGAGQPVHVAARGDPHPPHARHRRASFCSSSGPAPTGAHRRRVSAWRRPGHDARGKPKPTSSLAAGDSAEVGLSGQRGGEASASAVQPARDRPLAYPECAGGLGVGQADDVDGHERIAEVGRGARRSVRRARAFPRQRMGPGGGSACPGGSIPRS